MSQSHSTSERSARIAVLPDRGVVAVTGPDAKKLLAGIITNEMDLLDAQPALFAGLLNPQGKILFEFFVVQAPHDSPDGVLLDVARDHAGDLVERLAMYKLRAKAEVADVSPTHAVWAFWSDKGDGIPNAEQTLSAGIRYPDPRLSGMGLRFIQPRSAVPPVGQVEIVGYHAHRIALGVPEGGKDYDFGDAYPHEANFDILNGVSFDKGCYVGQEVVARMQHKTVVRKRVVRVRATCDLPPARPDIRAGEAIIGRLGSVAGGAGLALLRLDRVIEFQDKGLAITADGIALDVGTAAIERYRTTAAGRAAAP